MKYALTCSVESRLNLDTTLKITKDDLDFEFIPNGNKRFSELKITAPILNPQSFHSRIQPGEAGAPHQITLIRDSQLHNKILLQFQKLESLLSFNGEIVERIRWDQAKEEVICESDDERTAANIFSFHVTEEYPKECLRLKLGSLEQIINVKDRFDELIIPMAFWREGNNDFHAFRYINAYYNFYFIIEGLYGAGKTKNAAVERELAASSEFCLIAENLIKTYEEDKKPRHREKIKELLAARSKKLDLEGIIHLLVMSRGEMSHFRNNPNRQQATPFSHRTYESLSHMALVLSAHAISLRIIAINRSLNGIKSQI